MKKLFIITATLLVFVSCEKEKYDYIPKEQKPILQTNDTVYFVNHQDNSIVDTFVIFFNNDYMVYDKRY